MGTAAYMSPEQARGKLVDRRADIWAFGCLLYEMLTASRPFRGDGATEVLANVLKESPDFAALPPETPPLLGRLLRRCLEKDPRDRLRDIADARVDLSDTTVGMPTESRRSGLSSRGLLVSAGVLVVLVSGFTLTRFWSPDTSSQGARQFVLLPPEGAAFGLGVMDRTPAFALSPDGRRLAFIATRNGVRSIWLRETSALDAQPVSGTEGAAGSPAWSPDGSSLAFFAGGTLRTVSAGGGTPIRLADAPRGRGITWNSADEIVFGPGIGLGLLRVPASGGTARPVTELGPNDRSHVYPRFLRVYPGFPTLFWGLSVFFVGDLMGKALWKLVENAARFPRRGGRVLCVHGAVSFHRARPCGPRWLPGRGAMRHVELDRRVLGLQSTGE